MSVETDNKNFVTSVLSWAGAEAPDFSKYTYGLWAVVFENVNNGLGGYSMPSPLLEDIASANFLITGKKYSILDFDGKKPEAKFFITKGVKGINGYTSNEPVAEITNSFVSGAKPIVTMPDMDFPGKIYRRTEVTGNQLSFITKNTVLAVSGEDWAQTNISVFSNNTDLDYSYIDATYTGYSNEVVTRYKFLYDDSSNSAPQDVSSFEIPFQIENGSLIKYRIARKSDPLGSSEFPDYSADGKVVIDYSKYKDEVSGILDSSINYNFQPPISFNLTQDDISNIFKDNKTVYKNIADEAITDFRASKETVGGDDYLTIALLATGDTENVYRLDGEIEKYKLNSKNGINGYVMSEYKMSASDSIKTLSLAVNDLVYPRITESGGVYKLNDVEDLVDILEVIESEKYAQDLESQQAIAEEEDGETFKALTDGFKSYSDQLKAALQEDDGSYEGSNESVSEIIQERYEQDIKDTNDLLNQNNQIISYKVTLPNFLLPKKTYTQDYFSNYLNTGEQYILTPLSNYTSIPIFAFYGNQYGTLAYYINEDPARQQITNQPFYRTVVNSTCKGIYINESSFCKGDSAIYDNRSYSSNGVNFQNGLVTEIPSSNGVIKKENYVTLDSWKNAVNYYYTKNYVSSFSVQPSFSDQDYLNLFTAAFNKVKSIIQGPSSESSSNDSFYKKGGLVPRIFIEREIYTEKYNENQTQEFNRSFSNYSTITDDADLSAEETDKLYCVQTYDVNDFVKINQQFFNPIHSYDETLEFKEFFPESSVIYQVDEGSDFGNVLFQDKNPNYKKIFRAEYAVGSASEFTYTNFSSSQAWQGSNGGTIGITSQNSEKYSYHLYGYNANGDPLVLKNSNVSNGDIANVAPYSYGVVIKFTRLEYANRTYEYQIIDANGNATTYSALAASIVDNNLNLISSSLVKVNIQTYDYSIVSSSSISSWWLFNENPINNNIYGERDTLGYIQPRFFQDETEDNKLILASLFSLPNGPYTSKNYEGSPASISDINALADGLFSNNIYVKEEPGDITTNKYSYESNCLIDFDDNGSFTKQKAPQSISNKQNITDFSITRRLRITRVKYNFYVKDLVLIGDAGFPYSINYNEGWEYKLQYREKDSADEWSTLDEDGSFSKDKISVQSSQISPYYYSASDLAIPNFLSMIAFKTNLPLFLDDNDYEFRIAKYEKLTVSTQNVDVIKKTNFLPIEVDWNADPECSYYNIYQKDRAGNLTLIKTQNQNLATSYAIPDVKQLYVDQGVFNFGGLNGINYYDMVVSGVVPATTISESSLSSQYNGIEIGDSNNQISINKLAGSNKQYTTKAITNVTYSSLIDFNNPETKTSNFTISPNYNGYYFIADGATSVAFDNVTTPFESYVANLNASACNVNGVSVATNNAAVIQGPGAPSTVAISSTPASSFDLSDAENGSSIYLKNSIIVTDNALLATTISLKAINDSNAIVTVSYQSSSITINPNETAFLTFDPSVVTKNSTISNITVQDESINYPAKGLVNIDHSDLYLDPNDTFTNLPIYNVSDESLLINDSVSLNKNSFNYVNWNGTTATNVEKSYFDDIKIYLVGGDNADSNGVFYLKDDTEIILDNYAENSSEVSDEYYFIKDETVNRNLNIKITNGSSTFTIPRGNQDFKLSVDKAKNGTISYKILYPSDNPFFDIDDSLEQLVLLSNDSVQYINLAYLEAKIPKNAFVYFVNKNSNPVYFYRGSISKPESSLSQNQIARACIVTSGSAKSIKIDILNNAYSHFEFDIKPSEHLTSAVNILNLDFCGTQINIPPVSNFNGKELFLICRNRIVPNRVNPKDVSSTVSLIQDSDNPETDDVNEKGQISDRSISLKLYKKDVSDKLPTLERTSFLEFTADNSTPLVVQNDISISEDRTEYFYINDNGNNLNNFVLRDYYSRKNSYKGKIFTQKEKPFAVSSFDDKHNFSFPSTDCLSFDYSPDNFANGRLEVTNNSNAAIYNSISEYGSTQVNFNLSVSTNQIVANFSYDSVIVQTVSNKRLNKNRIFKRTGSNITYPIYNKKEFFISTSVSDTWSHVSEGTSYYIIDAINTDIDSIIIPDSSDRELIIKNKSGRTYNIQSISYNGTTYSTTISPEEQIRLSYSVNWIKSVNSSNIPDSALIIKFSNQQYEADPTHPLSELWADGFAANIIQESFVGDDIEIGVDSYSYLDYTSGWSASSGNIIYCFGRRKDVSDISINNYLVNAFYVYIYYQPNKDEDGFIIKNMQFYSDGATEIPGGIYDLNVIEEKHVDLSKYFDNYNTISSLSDVILIPIASQLTYYYLPNLDNKIQNPATNEEKTLGDWIQNKKIIFVNLCKSNDSAPNRIVNYSTTTSINNSFSTLSFTAGVSSWTTSTGTKPEVKTVYATIRNIKNTTSISTSEIYDGSEFVYLNNFSNFIVDSTSFVNGQLGDFYLFNSALNNIFVKKGSTVSQLQGYRFSKISVRQSVSNVYSKDLGINGSASFVVSQIEYNKLPANLEKEINNTYPKLKFGTFIKALISIGQNKYTYLFKYNENRIAKAIEIKDEDFASLDLEKILSALPNHRLFVYGSSQINEEGNSFDSYNLKLLNTTSLGSDKFYIQNNTPKAMSIYFKESDVVSEINVYLPPRRMVEISSNSAAFMEHHQKGRFYIGRNKNNINYIQKSNFPLFLDNLLGYKNLNSNAEKISDSDLNVFVSFLSDYFSYCYYSYYRNDELFDNAYSENRKFASITNVDSMSLNQNVDIVKPNIKITSAGHYILNNSDNDLKITLGSSEIFLVNNCAKDIYVEKTNATDNKNIVLFRNTVLVTKNTSDRYLKKAKRRDEFYCVFNPRTTISTQREITLQLGIPRNNDVFPILDLENNQQQSYVKLLSKDGSFNTIYFSLSDYYNGKDVPTDSAQNVVGYELGIGHETFYKFLFFNPSNLAYTMPGIQAGETYQVSIDDGLFRDLKNLPDVYGSSDSRSILNPAIIYEGVEYYNEQTFVGKSSSNYEVRYPNYVKLSRVVYNIDKTFEPESKEQDQIDENIPLEEKPLNEAGLFNQTIKEKTPVLFKSVISWIPQSEEAFWLQSDFSKDIWLIESIDPSNTITIAYPDGSSNRYVKFTKCTLKKEDLKSVIYNFSFNLSSALQERKMIADQRDLLIGLDGDLDDKQIAKVKGWLNQDENKQDFLLNSKEMILGSIYRNNLLPEEKDNPAILKTSSCQIKFQLTKLNKFPSIKFEDLSKDETVKFLNGK